MFLFIPIFFNKIALPANTTKPIIIQKGCHENQVHSLFIINVAHTYADRNPYKTNGGYQQQN